MSDQTTSRALARKHLDNALVHFRTAAQQPRPPKGWIRAIRNALGMTSRQLAARMGHSQSTVTAMEQGEAVGTVTINTLHKAAAALDCQLVYALVPRTTLDEKVRARAREVATTQLALVSHTMNLENQGLTESDLSDELDRLVETLLAGRSSRLWENE